LENDGHGVVPFWFGFGVEMQKARPLSQPGSRIGDVILI